MLTSNTPYAEGTEVSHFCTLQMDFFCLRLRRTLTRNKREVVFQKQSCGRKTWIMEVKENIVQLREKRFPGGAWSYRSSTSCHAANEHPGTRTRGRRVNWELEMPQVNGGCVACPKTTTSCYNKS